LFSSDFQDRAAARWIDGHRSADFGGARRNQRRLACDWAIDMNSQLMCVNIGHGDRRVIEAIQRLR
jgi:hypothetical protein